jgi:hypothetical protein
MDRLAWDLGDPSGQMRRFTNINGLDTLISASFHPMKGPMLTPSLQDIIGHEPFHWLGDKVSIEEFNSTFTNLQAGASILKPDEMGDLKSFFASVHFPPNPFRNFDNTFPASIVLTGLVQVADTRLLPGNPTRGMTSYRSACLRCHTWPTGIAPPQMLVNGRWKKLPVGPHGEEHLAQLRTFRPDFPTKVPQLRNFLDREGMNFGTTNSHVGFAFTQTGATDSLARFLADNFGIRDQSASDMIAFLLCLNGSGFPPESTNRVDNPPQASAQDVAAGVGRQLTVSESVHVPLIDEMLKIALAATGRVEVVVRQHNGWRTRGWLYRRDGRFFQSDRRAEKASIEELLGLAGPGLELTFTVVPEGTGTRLGLDRDEDGFFDQDELDYGFDPLDAASAPAPLKLFAATSGDPIALHWNTLPGAVYQIWVLDGVGGKPWRVVEELTADDDELTYSDSVPAGVAARLYRIEWVR